MGIEQYLFGFYVFVLICLVLVLYRFLFSDIKRQRMLLEEKESKLIKLYSTIEDMMDDFMASAEDSKLEADKSVKKIKELGEGLERQYSAVTSPPPAPPEKKSGGKKAQKEVKIDLVAGAEEEELLKAAPAIEEPLPFRELLTNTSGEIELPDMLARKENMDIIELAQQGKSRSQIAKELGITLSEVDLVIGISKKNV